MEIMISRFNNLGLVAHPHQTGQASHDLGAVARVPQ